MSHPKVHNHYRTMTRKEVADQPGRLATELKAERRISSRSSAVAVLARIDRDFQIDANNGCAACRFESRAVASTTESQLRPCLKGVQFPTSERDLIEAAISNGCAAEDTVDALLAISPVNLCKRHAGGRISLDCRHRR